MAAASTLWPILIFTLIIAALSQYFSTYEYNAIGARVYVKKDKLFFLILVISMCLFVGLRRWCNDTGTYREIYVYLTSGSGNIFRGIRWDLDDSPGFQLVNRILKHMNFSSQSYLMFYAIVTNAIYLWFLRKYSNDFWLTIFLFWTMDVYIFTAAALRQCIAIAFALIGVDRLLKGKNVKFLIWILLASTFHAYALIFLVAYFLRFKPWTKYTYILFAASFAVGVSLESLLGGILKISDMVGSEYDKNSFTGEGVNLFRLLVIWAPIILSLFLSKYMGTNDDSDNKSSNLFFNFSCINAGIMFIALFGTANYFARLANFFLIFQTLSLPWMISCFDVKSRRILKIVVIVCYALYFIFAHVILTPFNSYFAKMSFFEYIKIIFEV